MNSGYLIESNVGIGMPHHASPGTHHSNSFTTNPIHHSTNITPQTINPHIHFNNRLGNFEPLKLPLSNQLENHPSLCNTTRQDTYSNHNHIILPTKPCIDSQDGSNYFQFSASSLPLGRH